MTAVVTPRRPGRAASTAPIYHVDVVLIASALAVTGLGLLMVYSATRGVVPGDSFYFVKRQAAAAVVGIAAFCALLLVDYRRMRELSFVAYAAILALLLAVKSPLGSSVKGTQGWFALPGGLQLQPSELAKVGLVVALAGYLAQHRGELDASRLAGAVALVAVPLGLVLLQPDLGTAFVLGVVALACLAVAGLRGRHLAVLTLIGAVAVVAVVQLGVLKQYQVDRWTSFLNQDAPSGATYNVDQSKNAIGNGGVFGQGFLKGTQTNLRFVPEQHTDFIFTVVAEELGFAGAAVLLGLFGVLSWRCWRTARLAGDLFGTLVCIGVLAMLAVHVFENVGMTMGIMPVTGIPLPMMSYGGSAMVATWAALGLVANVHMRRFA